jgi:endoglucanase
MSRGGAAGVAQGGSSASGGSGGTGGTTGSGGAVSTAGSANGAGTGGSGGAAMGGAGAGTGGSSSGAAAAGGRAAIGGAPSGGATSGASGASGASATVDAATMAKAMGFGANIGNTLENTTSWETGWGEPLITQTYINGMASHGIKTVRVPVAWNTYAVNGVIDSTKMDRVKQVVSWIEAAGMYSIVNIHWDGGWIDNDTDGNPNRYELTDDVKTKFASYWTQIATAFASVGNDLIFEGLNEESKFYVNGDSSQAPDYAALNTLNQLFVTTVRAQAGYNASRALLIAGFTTDIDLTCVDAFTVPSDPAGTGKLFLSIHYYTPYTFCGLDTVESWGSPQTTWGTDSDKSTLDGLFTKLGTFSMQKSIPVILGEFAVTRGQNYPRDPASRILWMESVAKASFARGVVPVLWDTGSEISRTDGSFSTELQTVMADIAQ